MSKTAALTLMGLALAASCREKAPEPSPASRDAVARLEKPPPPMTVDPVAAPELQDIQRLLAARNDQTRIEWEVEREDRKELVRPAPAGFKPEAPGRKLRLTLVPQKTQLRVGERLWYRLELRNAGNEPVWIHDDIFKNGVPNRTRCQFWVTGPDDKRTKLFLGPPLSFADYGPAHGEELVIPGGEKMTAAERVLYVQRLNLRYAAQRRVSIRVLPGETLVTRPWRFVDPIEYLERERRGERSEDIFRAPPGEFRELLFLYGFKLPGTYRIQVVSDDPPPPPHDEERLQRLMKETGQNRDSVLKYFAEIRQDRLGRTESNVVALEVVP